MKVKTILLVTVLCSLLAVNRSFAQDGNKVSLASATDPKADADLELKAADWVKSLNLNNPAKEGIVKTALAKHLESVRDWHNDHPASIVPAGINPTTGNRLSEMDRDIIANSAMPRSIHDTLINVLNRELGPEQVETVLDKYTVGKVEFTLKGYHAIVPDLKPEEEAQILTYLKQAREQAIDFKNMKEISAIFEIYKTKCEQYLNSNGRNWHQLFKAYVDAVKAKKANEKQKQKD